MMNKQIQEIMKLYSKNPELAKKKVQEHKWTRKDLKLMKAAKKSMTYKLFPKQTKQIIEDIISSAENRLEDKKRR